MNTVADLVAHKILYTVSGDTSLDQCLRTMLQHCVQTLPVVNDVNECIGVITERDVRLAAESPLLHTETAADVLDGLAKHKVADMMHVSVVTIDSDAPIVDAAKLIRVRGVGGLPVVQAGTRTVIGVCTRSDLIDHLIRLMEPSVAADQ